MGEIKRLTVAQYRAMGKEYTIWSSQSARSLSFAGVALVWVFRNEDKTLPLLLIIAAFFFMSALFFDLLQYVVGGVLWRSFARHHENNDIDDDEQVEAHHPWRRYVVDGFYWVKISSVLLAYIFIVSHLYKIIIP